MNDQRQLEHYDDPMRRQQLASKKLDEPATRDLLELGREKLLQSQGVPAELFKGSCKLAPNKEKPCPPSST